MNKRQLLNVLFLIALGMGLGFCCGRWSAPSNGPGDVAKSGEHPSNDQNSRTHMQVVSGKKDDRPAKAVVGEDSISVDLLSAAMKVGVVAPSAADFFSQSDASIEALQITDQEKRELQDRWREVVQQIRVKEVQKADFMEDDDGTVSFVIDPLVDDRAVLKRSFEDAATEILGGERAAVLLAMKGGDELLAGGDKVVKLTVGVEQSGANSWQFRIEEVRNEKRRVWLADAVPAELKHLTDAAGVVGRISEAVDAEDTE